MTCGPGTFGDWLVPDQIGPVDVSKACADHDRTYADHKYSRRTADAVFYAALLVAGRDLAGSVGRSYRRRTWIYWFAVRVFGGLAWRRAG